MLDNVFSWLDKNTSIFDTYGVSIVERFRTPDNVSEPAMYVDVENEVNYARITIWENGNCDIYIYEIESMEMISSMHLELVDDIGIVSAFNLMLAKMQRKGDGGAVEKVYNKWSILKEIHPSMQNSLSEEKGTAT